MKRKEVVLTAVGLAVGIGEALVYYSMGKSEGHGFKLRMPPGKEFIKTVGVVLTTSVLTTLLFTGLEYMMSSDEEKLIAENKQKG